MPKTSFSNLNAFAEKINKVNVNFNGNMQFLIPTVTLTKRKMFADFSKIIHWVVFVYYARNAQIAHAISFCMINK